MIPEVSKWKDARVLVQPLSETKALHTAPYTQRPSLRTVNFGWKMSVSGHLRAHPRFAASSLCPPTSSYPFSEFHLILSPQGAGTVTYRNCYPKVEGHMWNTWRRAWSIRVYIVAPMGLFPTEHVTDSLLARKSWKLTFWLFFILPLPGSAPC